MGQESWCGQLAQFGFELSMVVGAGRKTNFVSSLPFPKFLPELAMRTAQSTEKVQAARAAFPAALSGSNHKASGSAGGYLLAEHSGAERPYRMQSLLGRSRWEADRLRDEVRAYALEALSESDAVLVVDETGFVKKGDHSVGVARQYSGAAGRIENSQVGVFLAYASRYGQTLIDRRLYLPEKWAADASRRAAAATRQLGRPLTDN
jgi:hypothetical protein